MIVVVASPSDPGVSALMARRSPVPVRRLTAADLSRPGWRVGPGDSRAVIDGEVVAVSAITGVLVRIPAVLGNDLPSMRGVDRQYAATEMTAFLVHWLSSLTCPVLNPPRGSALCAPSWRTERWLLTAASLGLEVVARSHVTPRFDPRPSPPAGERGTGRGLVAVSVIGGQCPGSPDPQHADAARKLARLAGVEMLVAVFDEQDRFVDAHPWVNPHEPGIVDAVLGFLAGVPA
jgi:hypothetical protein